MSKRAPRAALTHSFLILLFEIEFPNFEGKADHLADEEEGAEGGGDGEEDVDAEGAQVRPHAVGVGLPAARCEII